VPGRHSGYHGRNDARQATERVDPSQQRRNEHAAHLGDLSEAILATGSVSGELLGEPSAELRTQMADGVVGLFTPYLSM
jgi:hypothetical protein